MSRHFEADVGKQHIVNILSWYFHRLTYIRIKPAEGVAGTSAPHTGRTFVFRLPSSVTVWLICIKMVTQQDFFLFRD